MARVEWLPALYRLRGGSGLVAALSACLMLGACAQGPAELGLAPQLAGAEPTSTASNDDKQDHQRLELEKATEWWGRKFGENPRDLEAALSYARNLKAMGEKQRALGVLQQAAVFHGESHELASEYGRLALDLDQVSVANRLLAAADDPGHPDWRVISARGTVLAKQGKYADAIPYYEHALMLAPDHPSILSNLALARAMNGEPAKAEQMLRQAAAIDGSSKKIRQNLALVLGLQGKYAEAKQLASLDMPANSAAQNNDYLRRVVKLEPRQAPAAEDEPRVAAIPAPEEADPAPIKVAAAAHRPAARAAVPVKLAQQAVVLPVPKRNVMLATSVPKPAPAAKPVAKLAQATTGSGTAQLAQDKAKVPVKVAQRQVADPTWKVVHVQRAKADAKMAKAAKPASNVAQAGATKSPVAAPSPANAPEAPSAGDWTTQVALADRPKKKR
jgi:Flp pilus assembly protein TadD